MLKDFFGSLFICYAVVNMGAKINIAFNQNVISNTDVSELAESLPSIVAEAIGERDVFLYIGRLLHSVRADPIEIFIEVNIYKIDASQDLNSRVATKIAEWKSNASLKHKINLNIFPVAWYSTVGI